MHPRCVGDIHRECPHPILGSHPERAQRFLVHLPCNLVLECQTVPSQTAGAQAAPRRLAGTQAPYP
ncbi:hypothetical protein B0H19DRAFT_1145126 [Mycena capillaripes]|nr:hypothetical protein B0H19DRAFT_1145126 [Mycena capillaripes]